MAVVAALAVAGCGGSSGSEGSGNSAKAAGGTTTFRIAVGLAKGDPVSNAADAFAKRVNELSGGKLKGLVYYSGQLGSIAATENNTKSGSIQMNFNALDYLGEFYQPLHVLSLPYLFDSHQQTFDILDGSVGQKIAQDTVDKTGVRILGWFSFGFKGVADTKRPIYSPSDMQGLKVRVLPGPVEVDTFKAWGATAQTVDFAEVYTGLQQGVLDGVDAPSAAAISSKFYEVAKYFSGIDFLNQLGVMQVNNKWFTSLSPDLQDDVEQAAKEAIQSIRTETDKADADMKSKWQGLGGKYNGLSQQQHDAFVNSVTPVWNKYKGQYGAEGAAYFDQIMSATGNGS
jgi:tripartite ATP-independent transporter DctP family solute receptor